MSNLPIGAKSVLKVGNVGQEKTVLTGALLGTDNLNFGIDRDTRSVPGGRGVMSEQPGNYQKYDFGFVTDSNPTTEPVLREANGGRWEVELFPDGESSGSRKLEFQAVINTTLVLSHENDSSVYTVGVTVDGEVNES